jgi:hypothetical protein
MSSEAASGAIGRPGAAELVADLSHDEQRRGTQQLRSEFLRGQMRVWLEQVVEAGKTAELFEIEMWLRSFERFFRIRNQPLSDREQKALTLRNWAEELRLVDNVVQRVIHLCAAVLTEDQVNQARFGQYLEGYLKKDDTVDPFVEKLLRQNTPEAAITLLQEAFEDLHVLLADLGQLSRIPFATFQAVGKLIHRELRRSDLIALLIDKKFKPVHDRIRNPAVVAIIRRADPRERQHVAKTFLEFFRLLHYLRYASPDRLSEEELKSAVLIFSLITAETRLLLGYLGNVVLPGLEAETPLHGLYDSFVYCIPLELKKVINTELLDISLSRQTESIRARVENSHGILTDCFQQSVVQLAKLFDAQVDGGDVFDDFTEKLEQSVALREGLAEVIRAVRAFSKRKDESSARDMKEQVSRFYDHQMKYLMYRDWSGFEIFFIEILKCTSASGLAQIAHRFETFLLTLLREVSKRAILHGVPIRSDLAEIEASV